MNRRFFELAISFEDAKNKASDLYSQLIQAQNREAAALARAEGAERALDELELKSNEISEKLLEKENQVQQLNQALKNSNLDNDMLLEEFERDILPLLEELEELRSEKVSVDEEKRIAEEKLQQAINEANNITKKIDNVSDMGNFMTVLAKPFRKYDSLIHKKNDLQPYN